MCVQAQYRYITDLCIVVSYATSPSFRQIRAGDDEQWNDENGENVFQVRGALIATTVTSGSGVQATVHICLDSRSMQHDSLFSG